MARIINTLLAIPSNEPELQTKSVTPATTAQTVVADTGYELAQVNVGAVTASIDANIVAANIKKDVSILGVTGSFESANPVEVSTATEMNALLVAANEGKVYKYTGTTDSTYTNGDYYIVEVTP